MTSPKVQDLSHLQVFQTVVLGEAIQFIHQEIAVDVAKKQIRPEYLRGFVWGDLVR